MTIPELTPQEKALKRVLAISRLDGWSVIIFAVLGTLVTLVIGDFSGLGVGLLVAIAGWTEIVGHKKLKRRDVDGMKLLVRSQLLLLTVILVYCASRLGSFDGEAAMGNLTPDMEAILNEAGLARADVLPLVRIAFFATYGGVAFGTLLYQGGMTLYYRSKIQLVTEALAAPPRSPVSALPPSI